jgi:hypothetical protein
MNLLLLTDVSFTSAFNMTTPPYFSSARMFSGKRF